MGLRAPAIAVLISTAAVGCGDSSGGPTTPSLATVHIGGRIVDERTRQGVAGLTLRWGGGRAGLQQISSSTDATGSYQVDLPDQEFYSVSSTGISAVVRPIGSIDIVNFYVNMGGCPTQYGRIVDARTRRPVAGATVAWVGITSITDTAGSYRLGIDCRAGAYGSGLTTLTVNHEGYQPYSSQARAAESLGVTGAEERLDIALTPR